MTLLSILTFITAILIFKLGYHLGRLQSMKEDLEEYQDISEQLKEIHNKINKAL